MAQSQNSSVDLTIKGLLFLFYVRGGRWLRSSLTAAPDTSPASDSATAAS